MAIAILMISNRFSKNNVDISSYYLLHDSFFTDNNNIQEVNIRI